MKWLNYLWMFKNAFLCYFYLFFILLGAIKISDILPRRTQVKDKNTRSSVSQSVSYNVIRIDSWTMVHWIWPTFSVQTYDPSIIQNL